MMPRVQLNSAAATASRYSLSIKVTRGSDGEYASRSCSRAVTVSLSSDGAAL